MRILVVDDNRDIRNLIEQLISAEGYEVITAQSGLEALQRVAESRPDAVVLDINMPDIEGWEVCHRIKTRRRDLPVMLLSVRAEPEAIARGLELGADEYLSKPFDIPHFLDRLRAMIERYHHRSSS